MCLVKVTSYIQKKANLFLFNDDDFNFLRSEFPENWNFIYNSSIIPI